MKKKNTKSASAARNKRRTDVAERRNYELFRSGKWYIIRFDSLNYCLCNDDDAINTNRYYPTFAGALRGIAKYIDVQDVRDAIQQWHKLEAQIAAFSI